MIPSSSENIREISMKHSWWSHLVCKSCFEQSAAINDFLRYFRKFPVQLFYSLKWQLPLNSSRWLFKCNAISYNRKL